MQQIHTEEYFEFRARLLGEYRNRLLTEAQLIEAGRLIYERPTGLALYGVPGPTMARYGLRLLGRTVIECTVDAHAHSVADRLATGDLGVRVHDNGFVADLFCGSGNLGYHLGRRLGKPVFASELDPLVHDATRHNIDALGLDVDLNLMDYRDLLGRLPVRGEGDVYVVEPPWGPAFTVDGLDLLRTSPPVPEILDDIQRSRLGRPCVVVIKTNDQISNDSLARSFAKDRLLTSIAPPATLPKGANMHFHLYLLGAR